MNFVPGSKITINHINNKIVNHKSSSVLNTIILVTSKEYCFILCEEEFAIDNSGNFTFYIIGNDCKNTWSDQEYNLIDNIEQYYGKYGMWVNENLISLYNPKKIENGFDGCKCDNCKDFIHLAEPNQIGGGFICFACSQNKFRRCGLE